MKIKGYTLIELLIVITIVAVLSGVSLFALRGARESGRDTRRKTDLQSIANGLEIYKSDCKYYPDSLSAGTSLDGGDSPCAIGSTNVYIQSIPDDQNSTLDYLYMPLSCTSGTSCTRFQLWAAVETQPTPTLNPNICPTPASGAPDCDSSATTLNCNYCVTNP